MRSKILFIFISSYLALSFGTLVAHSEELRGGDSFQNKKCSSLLQNPRAQIRGLGTDGGIKVINLRSKPRFFSPEKSHFELSLQVGPKARIYFSRIIQTDQDPDNQVYQNEEFERMMNLALQYADHLQNHGIFSRELENFGILNTILLSGPDNDLAEEPSNSGLQSLPQEVRSELLKTDLKIQQIHNKISSLGVQEFDPESLGELLLHLTQGKERLIFALQELTEVQVRYRLLEIQNNLNENKELLKSEFAKELANLLKNDSDTLLKVLLNDPSRALMPWTIATQHPQDRLMTALIYELLSNNPQELEFIKIFSTPEPEDED